jgi:hypothetical protein
MNERTPLFKRSIYEETNHDALASVNEPITGTVRRHRSISSPRGYAYKSKLLSIGVGCLVVATISIGIYAIHRNSKNAAVGTSLPISITSKITTFMPYTPHLLDGFTISLRSVKYSQNVLLFNMSDKLAETVTVTEQILPTSVEAARYPSATTVEGADGQALIDYSGTETIGTLFSNPYKGVPTMVIINTTAPIQQSDMEDLLRGLRPVR